MRPVVGKALLTLTVLLLPSTLVDAQTPAPPPAARAPGAPPVSSPSSPEITIRTTPKFVPQSLPEPGKSAAAAGLPETFEIGLSTEQIVIASNFSGARLVVFGALDNADGRVLRQGGYDIVVALEGPKTPLVVREKERVLGLWINRGSESFSSAPASYTLASTRPLN
ncbi:MAG: hypothetical protein EOP35_26565, partial [Rubrivivax sp.]